MIREVFSIQQLEELQKIMTSVINECYRLKEWTAAPERMEKQIADYEQIQRVLITYTIDRRIMDEKKGDGKGLQPGEKAREPVNEHAGL